jgi:tripeptide aminopeptidase
MSPAPKLRRERLLERLLGLIRLPSPSRHERPVADRVLAELRQLGIEASEDDAGRRLGGDAGNVFAHVPGSGPEAPAVLFCAHMDTVPVAGEIRPRVSGDEIRSDGATILGADDKCGIAALLEALTVLRETRLPHAPLDILFTVGEETGLEGAKAFDVSRLRARVGYALDHSDPLSVVRGAPAKAEMHFLVRGVGGHAARPARTLNPILAAARGIALMPPPQADAVSTTNVGVIGGGSAVNVVPPEVEALAEARSHDPERLALLVEQMQAAMRAGAEQTTALIDGCRRVCTVQTEVTWPYQRYLVEESHPVVQRAFAAIRAAGGQPSSLIGQGGQDANILNQAGVVTVALGTGAHSPHTPDEYARVDETMTTAWVVLDLMISPPR